MHLSSFLTLLLLTSHGLATPIPSPEAEAAPEPNLIDPSPFLDGEILETRTIGKRWVKEYVETLRKFYYLFDDYDSYARRSFFQLEPAARDQPRLKEIYEKYAASAREFSDNLTQLKWAIDQLPPDIQS